MIEDELLKWRFKRGSREALRRIYEKYLDYLLTLAMALLNDANSAEDIVHDVFVSFVKTVDNFKLRGSLKGYLATCVINRGRDHLRANKKKPVGLDGAGPVSSDLNDPRQTVICSEESQRVSSAMAQIPFEQREAVILHIKGGLKFKEIAELQQTTLSTAQGRYRYGLEKLRSILNSEVTR